MIHVRDGGQTTDGEALRETFELLRAEAAGVTVILHCFSAPAERALRGRRMGLVLLVRRQRHLSEVRAAARGRARRFPTSCCWSRPTPRSSPRSRRAGKPNQPANVVATAERLAELRGVSYPELEAAVEANAARVFGW